MELVEIILNQEGLKKYPAYKGKLEVKVIGNPTSGRYFLFDSDDNFYDALFKSTEVEFERILDRSN